MTFVESMKKWAPLGSTYARGVDIAKAGEVVGYDVTRLNGGTNVRIAGEVLGSGGRRYKTTVDLDIPRQEVDGASCSCPAFDNYGGMCKHAVALARVYLDDEGILALAGRKRPAKAAAPQAPRTRVAQQASAPTCPAPKPAKPKAPRIAPTSREMADLIAVYASGRGASAVAASHARPTRDGTLEEKVDLLVTFSALIDSYWNPRRNYNPERATWQLKLRVKRGPVTYVVKNVDDLVHYWHVGAHVSYGKNLAFTHTPANFTNRANELLDLVSRIVRSQRALFNSRDQYWDAGRGTDVKDLPLATDDVIDILDVMRGGEVTFDPSDRTYQRKPRTLKVINGRPRLRFELAQTPDGGYDLALPAETDCVLSGERIYVLTPDRAWRAGAEYAREVGPLLSALLPRDKPLHISRKDMEPFCGAVLPALQKYTDLRGATGLEDVTPPSAEIVFKVGLSGGKVSCKGTVSYGEDSLGLFEPIRYGQPLRDAATELAAQEVVRAYFPFGDTDSPAYGEAVSQTSPTASARAANGVGSYYGGYGSSGSYGRYATNRREDPWFDADDPESMYLLLTDGLRELAELGEVLLSEKLKAIDARPSPFLHVTASVRGGLLDLAVDADGLDPADLMAYLASYRRRERYVRLSNGDIVRLDEGVRAVAQLADDLGLDDRAFVDGCAQLPLNRTLFVDALLEQAQGVSFDRDDGFRRIVRDFDSIANADVDVPQDLVATLRPYQDEGFRWLSVLGRLGFGGILADDMGLGKTLQVIAYLLARREAAQGEATDPDNARTKPALVVCPASLVYNWMAELARFAPGLEAAAVIGTKAQRRSAIAASPDLDVLVTSYDLMKRDVEEYAAQDWGCVVLDEAQYIKNHTTQVAKAAKSIPADVRFALTGTPIENRLTELWSIFDFLMPGILGTRESFSRRFEGSAAQQDATAGKRLQCMVGPFILRRLKGDVLRDLPEKNESVVYAQMTGEQAKLYKANQDRIALTLAHQMPEEFAQNKLQILAELTRLRQLCCDPRLTYDDYAGPSAKLDTAADLISSAVEGGHRVLLFSQFTSMFEYIGARLDAAGIAHLELTGATSKPERARLVDCFQAGEAPVFLISLKAGGVGLNLTAADVVIHYDPWWNLAAQNQATDRAHRIGQTRQVSVFKLIAKDTVEERIVAMQEAKRDLAESVLGGEAVATAKLTREDLLALLGA